MYKTYKRCIVLTGKPGRKKPLRRFRNRWQGNSKTSFKDTVWEDMDLIHAAKDRGQWQALVYISINFGSRKDGELLIYLYVNDYQFFKNSSQCSQMQVYCSVPHPLQASVGRLH
jgi:hypothetical protein